MKHTRPSSEDIPVTSPDLQQSDIHEGNARVHGSLLLCDSAFLFWPWKPSGHRESRGACVHGWRRTEMTVTKEDAH